MDKNSLFYKRKSITADERMIQFDFSKKEFQECFTAELGGEKTLRDEFPYLYECFKTAIIRDQNKQSSDVYGEPVAFRDSVDIFYGCYDKSKKHVLCKSVTSLTQNMANISHRLQVFQENGRLLFDVGRAEIDCHHAVLDVDRCEELMGGGGNLIFQYFSMWINYEDELYAAYYTAEDSCTWDAHNYIDSFRMINPVHKKTAENEPILICYDRTAQTGEHVDYSYKAAFDPATKKQKLYLEVGAQVQLQEEAGKFIGIDAAQCMLKLDCQRGIAQYNGAWDESKFVLSDKGFVFNLDEDWKTIVPSSRLPIRDLIDFSLKLKFVTDKNIQNYIYVASGSAKPGVFPISQLQLLWGCVAPDTPILMSDGSIKAAKEIVLGDRVSLEDGNGIVKEIYDGRELRPLLCIETFNGRKICCTSFHPVLTRRGFITAGELVGSDEIKDVEAGFVEIKMLYPVEQNQVINFDIEPDEAGKCAVLICDHLVTGDNSMQKACMDRLEEKNKKKLRDELNVQFMKLKEFFER